MPFRKPPFRCAGLLRYSSISSICLTSQDHQCLHHQLDDAAGGAGQGTAGGGADVIKPMRQWKTF